MDTTERVPAMNLTPKSFDPRDAMILEREVAGDIALA